MSTQTDPQEECRVITEVVFEKGREQCQDDEVFKREMGRLLGELDNEEPPDCDEVLVELGEEDLRSVRTTRRWVMCRAWELIESEEMSFGEATSEAWSEAREAGEELGIEV